MRVFSICLLILGLARFSKGSEDQPAVFYDSEDGSVDVYDELLEGLEETASQEDFQDAALPDLDGALVEEDTDSEESFDEAVLEALEEESQEDDLPAFSQDDLQDPASLELTAADLEEDSEDAFNEALLAAFKTWNADVKACSGDEACLARVNNVLRPIVNEAADIGALSVIEPCEDRVGTYEVETVDGWTIEAILPC